MSIGVTDRSIAPLVAYLRRIKVIGRANDYTTAKVLYQGNNAIVARFSEHNKIRDLWFIVVRSSRQYYKVTALVHSIDGDNAIYKTYRNYMFVADFIRTLI